jgi:hypothetical protein
MFRKHGHHLKIFITSILKQKRL